MNEWEDEGEGEFCDICDERIAGDACVTDDDATVCAGCYEVLERMELLRDWV